MPAVSKGDGMRGLAVFISDIRNCELPFCMLLHHMCCYFIVSSKLTWLMSLLVIVSHVRQRCHVVTSTQKAVSKKISLVTFSETINDFLRIDSNVTVVKSPAGTE